MMQKSSPMSNGNWFTKKNSKFILSMAISVSIFIAITIVYQYYIYSFWL